MVAIVYEDGHKYGDSNDSAAAFEVLSLLRFRPN